MTYPPCVTCHQDTPLDSVAAAFHDYNKGDGTNYKHDTKLPTPFLVITLRGKKIPNDDHDRLGKLMEILVDDTDDNFPFAKSMAKLAFRMLMQRESLKPPKPDEEDYVARMRRYKIENEFLTNMAKLLRTKDYNFRELIIEMAASQWFAATDKFNGPIPEERKKELELVGPGMPTPEMQAMRLQQVFGNESEIAGLMKDELNTDSGGIDSRAVRTRSRNPNAASELALDFTGFQADKEIVRDLAKPQDQRHLFKDFPWGKGIVEAPVYPGTLKSIPENEGIYRKTLARIFTLTYGEYHQPNSPEIDMALQDWVKMWQICLEDVGSGKIADSDRVDGMSADDPQCLIRTWGAYMTDIITDPKFSN